MCWHFKAGSCRDGNACLFSHVKSSAYVAEVAAEQSPKAEPKLKTEEQADQSRKDKAKAKAQGGAVCTKALGKAMMALLVIEGHGLMTPVMDSFMTTHTIVPCSEGQVSIRGLLLLYTSETNPSQFNEERNISHAAAYPAFVADEDDKPPPFVPEGSKGEASEPVSKSCLKQAKLDECSRKISWNLTSQEKRIELQNYECSTYTWYHWDKIQARRNGPSRAKPRDTPVKIRAAEKVAFKKATSLAKEVRRTMNGEACPASQQAAGRSFLVDSGASYHLIGRNYINNAERRSIRPAKFSIRLNTAAEQVEADEVVDLYVHSLGRSFTFYLLSDDMQPVLSMGQLADDFDFHGEYSTT